MVKNSARTAQSNVITSVFSGQWSLRQGAIGAILTEHATTNFARWNDNHTAAGWSRYPEHLLNVVTEGRSAQRKVLLTSVYGEQLNAPV